jgi:hypothetical protein
MRLGFVKRAQVGGKTTRTTILILVWNVQTVGKRMVRHFVRNATRENTNRAMELRFVSRAPLVRMPLLMGNLNARRVPSIGIQTKVVCRNARNV